MVRKGKFGVVVSLYPIIGFLCVLLGQPLLCALAFGAALLAERDEWAGRQSLQALGLCAASWALRFVFATVAGMFPQYYGGFFAFLGMAFGVLSVLVYLGAAVAALVALVRVARGREADLPGLCELAWRAYGMRRPRPVQAPPFQPPYYPPQPPQPPYPPQGPGPQQ